MRRSRRAATVKFIATDKGHYVETIKGMLPPALHLLLERVARISP
jgi:hypothetical protein